ncbi:MAG: transcription termination/antitermination protein NusA [Kofleriaceae bacterium]|nr:transcription termination/antitermination protein NusA [Myxococcales bacterium]MCB9573184.1 transcription termination/antitermination protein NusA [Kofleriaceae bacterium]
MEANLSMVLEQVGRDKNIDKSVLIQALEQAILTAAKKTFEGREMEATYNVETGSVDLFLIITVVEDDDIEGKEITVENARKYGLEAELGDELLFQIFYRAEDAERAAEQDAKFGDLIDLKAAHKKFGRIAAQTAKQVIYQRVREAERDNVYNEYKDRKGELITGIVRRFERGNVVVDVGKAEAILPVREQVPRESSRVGDTIKAYVLDIDRMARGPQIILSRTHKGLLEKLFEQEVPEIYEKIVRIESSAREPGARAKIAVSSRDRDVDPVGACVGMKGSRVQAVVQELRGEKIDIVPYDDDPARFVCNAIAPAEVSRVIIDAEGHRMELIVPDEKLSLAIGKKGQNVRLASQLTGWRIDIHSESKIQELERRAKEQIAAIEGVGYELSETLFKLGWRSVSDLTRAHAEELASVPGVKSVDGARAIIEAARSYLSSPRKRSDDARREVERRASMSADERWLDIPGVDEGLLQVFAGAGVTTPEDLIKTPIDQLATQTGLDMGDLAKLRQRAISWLAVTETPNH